MATILFVMAVIVAIGRFFDFLIGPNGDRKLKDGLVQFYVNTSEGSWRDLFVWFSQKYLSFLSFNFGLSSSYICFCTRVLVYSLTTTFIPFIIVILVNQYIPLWWWLSVPEARQNVIMYMTVVIPSREIPFYLLLAVFNFLLDLLAIIAIVYMLRKTNFKGLIGATFLFLICSILTYVLYLLSISFSVAINDGQYFSHPNLFHKMFREIEYIKFHPWNTTSTWGIFDWSFFSIGVGLPLVVYVILLFLVITVYMLRPFLQKPLSLICERIESSSSGVCTLLAGFLSGIIGVATAWQKLF